MTRQRLAYLAGQYTAAEIATLTGVPVGKVRSAAKRYGITLPSRLPDGYKKRMKDS